MRSSNMTKTVQLDDLTVLDLTPICSLLPPDATHETLFVLIIILGTSYCSSLEVVQVPRQLPVSCSAYLHAIFQDTHLIENILELVLSERRALNILDSPKLFRHPLPIFFAYRGHLLLRELISDAGVIPQISLGTDNKTWNAWTVVVHFWKPFFSDVLKGSGRRNGEADEEDISLRIR